MRWFLFGKAVQIPRVSAYFSFSYARNGIVVHIRIMVFARITVNKWWICFFFSLYFLERTKFPSNNFVNLVDCFCFLLRCSSAQERHKFFVFLFFIFCSTRYFGISVFSLFGCRFNFLYAVVRYRSVRTIAYVFCGRNIHSNTHIISVFFPWSATGLRLCIILCVCDVCERLAKYWFSLLRKYLPLSIYRTHK